MAVAHLSLQASSSKASVKHLLTRTYNIPSCQVHISCLHFTSVTSHQLQYHANLGLIGCVPSITHGTYALPAIAGRICKCFT